MRESRKLESLSRITIVMQISSSVDYDSKEMRKFGTGCDYVVTSTFSGGCEDSSFRSLTFSAIAPLEFPLCVFQFYYYSWGATEAEDLWPWQSQSSHTYSWEWFCFLLRRTKMLARKTIQTRQCCQWNFISVILWVAQNVLLFLLYLRYVPFITA